jgi:probable rRNA maturation factor
MDDDVSSDLADAPVEVYFDLQSEADRATRSLGSGWQHRLWATIQELWQTEQPGRGGKVGLIFVGTDRIRELNRMFRGKDRPTDVLSFDLSDSPDAVEGEVYIGADIARRQAKELGATVSEEVARLVIHGLLHLAGHDHHTPADGRHMAAATRRWLARWRASSSHMRDGEPSLPPRTRS